MDDAYVVVYRGDGMEELSYVERAALWAAIVAWVRAESEAIERGYNDDAFNERSARSRQHVRDLLGMEAES